MTIKVSNLRRLTDNRWLNLFQVSYETPNGNGEWQFASRKKNPEPSTDPLKADAVVIVPLWKQGRQRKLVVLKEFRIPLGDYEYSFPAGLPGDGEDLKAAAARELLEESGLKLTKVLAVSPPVVSSAGLSDESVVMMVVECVGEPNSRSAEHTEDIEVKLLDYEAVCRLRRSNEKISAKTWPVLLMFEALGKIAWPRRMKQIPGGSNGDANS